MGFSLLEIMLASAAAMVVGTLLISILVNSSGFFYQQQSIIDEGLSLNDTLGQITTYVKQASAVALSYPQTGTPLFTTSATTLVLKLPGISQSGVLPSLNDFVVVTKDSPSSTILWLKIFPDPGSSRGSSDMVLTTLVESIGFSYLDKTGNSVISANLAESIKIDLTVLAKKGSIGSKRSGSIIVNLRNIP